MATHHRTTHQPHRRSAQGQRPGHLRRRALGRRPAALRLHRRRHDRQGAHHRDRHDARRAGARRAHGDDPSQRAGAGQGRPVDSLGVLARLPDAERARRPPLRRARGARRRRRPTSRRAPRRISSTSRTPPSRGGSTSPRGWTRPTPRRAVNAGLPTDSAVGDFDGAFDGAEVKVDADLHDAVSVLPADGAARLPGGAERRGPDRLRRARRSSARRAPRSPARSGWTRSGSTS